MYYSGLGNQHVDVSFGIREFEYAPAVLKGIYRTKRSFTEYGVSRGDLCILSRDDESDSPRFTNPNWTLGRKYIQLCDVEFLGVFNGGK